ncbi:MAG: hypothetical protein RLZZ124_547, partial [Cyanobacteriota bacterium]
DVEAMAQAGTGDNLLEAPCRAG